MIFVATEDYRVFLATLASVIPRYEWQMLTYCLMPNHVHLLVRTPEPTLSKGMRTLTGIYARRFNTAHDRSGRVFEGRFQSALIESEEHLQRAFRYIAASPVETGLANDPSAWPWSAHEFLLGHRRPVAWLDVHRAMECFGANLRAGRRSYTRAVEASLPAS